MTLHVASGNWRRGLLLSLVAATMWAAVPIVVRVLLRSLDVYTITTARFLVSAVLLGLLLKSRRRLPSLSGMGGPGIGLLVLSALGLAGNYVLYSFALHFVSPNTTQIVIQLGPLLFLAGGLVIFGEHFARAQWIGVAVFSVGLVIFFHERLAELFRASGDDFAGVALVVLAALSWVAYALSQKQLLRRLSSDRILLGVYALAAILCLPFSSPTRVAGLEGAELALLAFCALTTLVAYGAFAEALDHWEASRVGAVIAVAPLLTILLMSLLGHWFPEQVVPEKLSALSLFGALIVVAGSALTSLGNRRSTP